MEAERYSLVRTIASGGMGQVYEAVARGHGGFSRRVAIKRLLPELLGDHGARDLFREEARIASYLHHSNIVQVLDYGVVDGAEFLVLEYVDGLDAHRLVRMHGKLPVPLAMYVVGEIAEALAYAHAKTDESGEPLSIVHRDVSVQNILVSWDGDVKLSDFGIALAATRETRTKTGLVKGKLGYMAPEQLLGGRASAGVDVYALGITLQVLVTGMGPGEATEAEMMLLSDEVRTLIAACTHDAPQDRCTASEVAVRAQLASQGTGRAALRSYLAHIRGRTSTPRSALDDLMGLALVPSGPGQFTISKVIEISPPSPASTPEAATHVANTLRPQAPSRSRRWLAVLLVLLVVAIALVVALEPFSSPPDRRASSASDALVASTTTSNTSTGSTPKIPSLPSIDAGVSDTSFSSSDAAVSNAGAGDGDARSTKDRSSTRRKSSETTQRPKRPHRDELPSEPKGSDVPVPPAPAPATGCLNISGAGDWNGAVITLAPAPPTGQPTQTAPVTLVVPLGTYRVDIATTPTSPVTRTVVVRGGKCASVGP